MIDRGDYWQCGYVLKKGSFDEVKRAGLDAFRTTVAAVSPLPASAWTRCGTGRTFRCFRCASTG